MTTKLGTVSIDKLSNTIIRTHQDSLATVLYLVNKRSLERPPIPDYDSVFNDSLFWEDHESRYDKLRNTIVPAEFVELATKIEEYYLGRYTQKRLESAYTSEWEDKSARALQNAKNNFVDAEDLTTFVKIQQFYDCAHAHIDFAKQYKSFDVAHNSRLEYDVVLRPVGHSLLPQKTEGQVYWFTDHKNRLYMIPIRAYSDLEKSIVETLYRTPGVQFDMSLFFEAKADNVIPEFTYAKVFASSITNEIIHTSAKTKIQRIF